MNRDLFKLFTSICALALLLAAGSCRKYENPAIGNNLVIVSDNDPANYVMIKILGEVRSSYPDIHITYLQSKPFDIYEGAFMLQTAVQSFPQGTVFAGIIEPGAGGRRLVFEVGKSRIFVPDNTLATRVLHQHPGTGCHLVENAGAMGGARPDTLSFEDFYSRAISSLLSGTGIAEFGAVCVNPKTFPVQDPVRDGNSILGEIVSTDFFGNCMTNIPASLMVDFQLESNLMLTSDSTRAALFYGVGFASVAAGENVCFINSSRILEMAVNMGNFAGKYHFSAGDRIRID